MDKLVKPNEINKQLTTLLQKRSSDGELDAWLACLMADTRRRYPNQTLTAETVDAYLTDWTKLVMEFGHASFLRKLEAARMESEFFPSPAAIKKQSDFTERPPDEWVSPTTEEIQAQADFDASPEGEKSREDWKAAVKRVAGTGETA
jgi:cation diffusion facilitator CzcD-associated flavoprotein CzcO